MLKRNNGTLTITPGLKGLVYTRLRERFGGQSPVNGAEGQSLILDPSPLLLGGRLGAPLGAYSLTGARGCPIPAGGGIPANSLGCGGSLGCGSSLG